MPSQETGRDILLHLEEEIHKRVVGQDEAVRKVIVAISSWILGISDPQRPIASFVLLGPGVGKTELAKAVATCLFNTEEALVRIDMSKLTEKHAVSWLIGTCPGHVGYEREHLTEIIHRRPQAVILLDEIDKAHPNALHMFNRVLDEGRVIDFEGHTVKFNNTLILMTSVVGSHIENDEEPKGVDYKTTRRRVRMAAESTFDPGFIARVDDFIVFRALT